MKPYYERDGITLLHGDCLELLPTMEAGIIDMVCADPPYGTTACKWDSIIPLKPLWTCLERVIKPCAAVVMTASQPFTTTLISSKQEWFRHEWIWNKCKGANFGSVRYEPLKIHENVIVFGEKAIRIFHQFEAEVSSPVGKRNLDKGSALYFASFGSKCNYGVGYPRSIQTFPIPNNWTGGGLHPTQKPITLMEYLIRTYTNEANTVLDFCFGSGTTLLAAWNLGRKGIGIESQEEYAEIAAKRIDAEISRGKLFKDDEPEPIEQATLEFNE